MYADTVILKYTISYSWHVIVMQSSPTSQKYLAKIKGLKINHYTIYDYTFNIRFTKMLTIFNVI